MKLNVNDFEIVLKDTQYLYVKTSHKIKQLLCDKQAVEYAAPPVLYCFFCKEPGHMKAQCVLKHSLEEPEEAEAVCGICYTRHDRDELCPKPSQPCHLCHRSGHSP